MKRLLVLMLVFSIHSVYAVQSGDPATKECVDCSTKKIEASPETQAELAEVEELNNKITDENLDSFVKSICSSALSFRDSIAEKAGDFMELKMLNFLGISKENKNYKKILTNFWNKNSHKFICTKEYGATSFTRSPQHFMKRIIDLGMYKPLFYKFLLSDPKGYSIDVNAVEVYDGKKETVIDYIDNILNSPNPSPYYNLKEIKSVRAWLVKGYKAKKAEDLD